MTLQAIISGVANIASSAAITVGEAAAAQFDANPTAVGKAYRTYDERYARIKIYDIGDLKTAGSYVAVPANQFSFVASQVPGSDPVPVFEIDYFILTSMSEVYVERMAPTYTFGAATMYTAGSDAKQFVYAGSLILNQLDGDARARFNQTYEYLLRASQLVTKNRHRYVELYYRDQVRRGYITSMTSHLASDTLNKIDVSFSMFVIDSFATPDP